MPTKRIVCLANSWKPGGYCVAGREILPNGRVEAWVRPVSHRQGEEVSVEEQRYPDGGLPQLLDVVDVPLLVHTPHHHQRENWLLNPRARWKKAGALAPQELSRLADVSAPLWVNGHSTQRGQNDRMPVEVARKVAGSLRLIRVDSVLFEVWNDGNRDRVRGRFSFNGDEYALGVTDPVCAGRLEAQGAGEHPRGKAWLTVSLGEEFHGYCYKLVAGVIELP